MKKILSFVLVALMVVSAFVMTTSAAAKDASAPYSGTEITSAWYSKKDKTITITTAEQLLFFLKEANSGATNYVGKNVVLGNDIVFNEGTYTNWEKNPPAYNLGVLTDTIGGFGGTFDGQNHTISGLYVSRLANASGTDELTGLKVTDWPGRQANNETTAGYVGLFSKTGDAGCTIKNLRITNSYFSGTYATGALIGCAVGDAVIENVQIDNTIVYATYTAVQDPANGDALNGLYEKHCSSGGVIGMTSGNLIIRFENVLYHGIVVGCGRFVGGICGNMQKSHLILNNVGFIGNYESRYGDVYTGQYLFKENSGGLVGRVSDNALADYAEIGTEFNNCFFIGYFKANPQSTTSGLLSGRCDLCTVNNFYANGDAYSYLLGQSDCRDTKEGAECHSVKKSELEGEGSVGLIGLDDSVWYAFKGTGPMLKVFKAAEEELDVIGSSIDVGNDDTPASSQQQGGDPAPASSDTATTGGDDAPASQAAPSTKKPSSTRRPSSQTGDITTYMIAAVVISAAAAVVISKSRKA